MNEFITELFDYIVYILVFRSPNLAKNTKIFRFLNFDRIIKWPRKLSMYIIKKTYKKFVIPLMVQISEKYLNGYKWVPTSYKNSITLFLFNITRNKLHAKNESRVGMRNGMYYAMY